MRKRSEGARAKQLLRYCKYKEVNVEIREENVKRREDFASEVNAVALLVGREAAQTITQATKLAAVALADDVNEHYDELVQAAKIGARTAFRTRVAPRARADVCAGASTRAVRDAPLRHELGILGANEAKHAASVILRSAEVRARAGRLAGLPAAAL